MNNDELMHFGISGMHWGQRKAAYKKEVADAKSKYTKTKQKYDNKNQIAKTIYKQEKKAAYSKYGMKGQTAAKATLGIIGGLAVTAAAGKFLSSPNSTKNFILGNLARNLPNVL